MRIDRRRQVVFAVTSQRQAPPRRWTTFAPVRPPVRNFLHGPDGELRRVTGYEHAAIRAGMPSERRSELSTLGSQLDAAMDSHLAAERRRTADLGEQLSRHAPEVDDPWAVVSRHSELADLGQRLSDALERRYRVDMLHRATVSGVDDDLWEF